jgi:S-adenosylmethionine synthetase
MTSPIEIFVAGRATRTWRGVEIPVDELAVEACRDVLRETLPELDVARDVRVVPKIGPGSSDLTSLFVRARAPLANDTSCGAGFAPLTDLERVVLAVERRLNDPATKRAHPSIGADVKVMGTRVDDRIALTIGCAFVGRHLASLEDYLRAKSGARELALDAARACTRCDVRASINAADAGADVYLTVTGTSAEAGDDGEVGRGNRTSGLIAPYRWQTLEAAAGKNPVSHVGKLYGVVATRVARRLAESVAREVSCMLVSEIGRPVDDPALAHVRLSTEDAVPERVVEEILRAELGSLGALRDEILAGRVGLF